MQLQIAEESKNDIENLWKTCENKLKSEQEKSLSLVKENSLLKESMDKVGTETSYFSDKISSLNSENQNLVHKINELKREISDMRLEKDNAEHSNRKSMEENSKSKAQLINLQTELNITKSENERITLDLENKSRQISHITAERDSLTKMLESGRKSWDSNDMRMSDLVRENQSLNENMYKLQQEINKLADEKRNIQTNLDSVNNK